MWRHWQDLDNKNWILNGRRDMELTEEWIKQAYNLANLITGTKIKFKKVFSSPLKRAHQTASIISEVGDFGKVEILEGLIERDFGIMSWKPHSSIEEICAPDILYTEHVKYFLNPEWAETFPQLYERAKREIELMQKTVPNWDILAITHWDFGKMMYAAYYNLDWKEVLQKFYFGNADLLLLSEKSSPEESHVFKISYSETDKQKI